MNVDQQTTPATLTRTPIRREDDDELLGFVVTDRARAADAGPTTARYRAVAMFGGLLGTHTDAGDAERQVREAGLGVLAERWWIHTGDRWQQCELVEASPDRLVAKVGDYPYLGPPEVIAPGTPLQLTPPR